MRPTSSYRLGLVPRPTQAIIAYAAAIAAAPLACAQVAAPAAPPPTPVETTTRAVDPVDVSDLLADLTDGKAVPGMAAVVVRGRTVIARGAAGVRRVGDTDPIRITDPFHLGSCTKAMTATLCAMLVEEGLLRWDSTVGELFPELFNDPEINPTPGWSSMTLRQLLTQTAGATRDLRQKGLWTRMWRTTLPPREARLDMLRTILLWEPDHTPGTEFEYSNTNFIIAGMMAERAAGEPWEELCQRRLFAPLGITGAVFGAPGRDAPDPKAFAWGTNGMGSPLSPSGEADNPPFLSPAGRAAMPLEDWAKFVALHIEGERPETARLLRAETYRTLHEPALDGYAMGWKVAKRPWGGPEGRVLSHGGSNTMWFAVAWLAPDKAAAVLVATNAAGDKATKAADTAAGRLIRRFVAEAPVIPQSAPDHRDTGVGSNTGD